MEIDSIVIHEDDDTDRPQRGVVTDIDWDDNGGELVRVYWFVGAGRWYESDSLIHVG